MRRPLTGSLKLDDYRDIKTGVDFCMTAVEYFHARGGRIEIPHTHRWWEYGTCVQMLLEQHLTSNKKLSDVDVLNVGSGWDGLSPTIALQFNSNMTEYEPSAYYRQDRVRINQILLEDGKKQIHSLGYSLEDMPEQDYDAVFCVSVLEHVDPATEKQCWRNLARRVRKGGIFFADVDCVPDPNKKYVFDELRTHNFTIDDMKERVAIMEEEGLVPIGEPDWNWNGAQVHDFTFFRVGMERR